MILSSNSEMRALLFGVKYRDAGESDINGRHVTWKAGDVVSYIPFEAKKAWLQKTLIRPSEVKRIYDQTATAHWGALAIITMQDDLIIDVRVIDDVFADYMNVEL